MRRTLRTKLVFEKGLVSSDNGCYMKKDNITYYGYNIDPTSLDDLIKSMKSKLDDYLVLKSEYEKLFGKI
jgi:hypothetical protein